MEIQCPKCRRGVPQEQVNMGTDLAFCPTCISTFKISVSVDLEVVNADTLRAPRLGRVVQEGNRQGDRRRAIEDTHDL